MSTIMVCLMGYRALKDIGQEEQAVLLRRGNWEIGDDDFGLYMLLPDRSKCTVPHLNTRDIGVCTGP